MSIAVRVPTVEPIGPGGAFHDQLCAVCWKNHAVLFTNTGVFEPCWACQDEGWETVRVLRRRWYWPFRKTVRERRAESREEDRP